MEELVWCIPREEWDQVEFEGFKRDEEGEIYRLLLERGVFKPRAAVENDSDFKQVIPQGLLRLNEEVFVNQRLPKQSDSRLLYAYSLGVGGHLNPEDDLLPHMDLIQLGLHREMSEEVVMPKPFSIKYIGITNDEQTEVSQMHVGVWFEIELINKDIIVREIEKLKGFWMKNHQLNSMEAEFESWAYYIYKEYLSKQC